jgi:hypothetical protein
LAFVQKIEIDTSRLSEVRCRWRNGVGDRFGVKGRRAPLLARRLGWA